MSYDAKNMEGPNEDLRQIAICARGLTKSYPIYDKPSLRLKQMLWPGRRKFHDEYVAVRNVDLEIYRGETVGIVGRNGSGKSTLLNLICGTLEASAGELEINGHLAPILTLGAGFDPEFTGRENVLMNAAIIGLTRETVESRLQSIIDFAGIGDFFERPVKLYSSGMYARLAFAVAINADPEIMVVDEVLSVGDEAFARKCHARLEELKAAGSTILFVSHNSQLVIELCDRALLLEDGERLLTSDPSSVVAYYHKLLYVSDENRGPLIDQIRHHDTTGERASASILLTDQEEAEFEKLGSFDPGLRPESTSEYERLGATIHGAKVLNSRGEKVNLLIRGGEYTYSYEVDFAEEAFAVRFGMMIKSVTGLDISGQVSHAAQDAIEHVPAGHRARVGFRFKADLAADTYFLNAGVMGVREGELIYLHRILDVLAIRIEATAEDRVTGRVDLALSGNWAEIVGPD